MYNKHTKGTKNWNLLYSRIAKQTTTAFYQIETVNGKKYEMNTGSQLIRLTGNLQTQSLLKQNLVNMVLVGLLWRYNKLMQLKRLSSE